MKRLLAAGLWLEPVFARAHEGSHEEETMTLSAYGLTPEMLVVGAGIIVALGVVIAHRR